MSLETTYPERVATLYTVLLMIIFDLILTDFTSSLVIPETYFGSFLFWSDARVS